MMQDKHLACSDLSVSTEMMAVMLSVAHWQFFLGDYNNCMIVQQITPNTEDNRPLRNLLTECWSLCNMWPPPGVTRQQN